MGESERVQLARSLHDGIAQELVALSYRIQLIEMRSDLSPELAGEMRALHSSISTLSRSIRDELLLLRDDEERAISDRLSQLIEESGFHGEFVLHNSVSAIPRTVSDALIELTRNALIHARATRIEISITSENGELLISIRDNGIGGAGARDGHFGLAGVAERVQTIGGEFGLLNENGTYAWIRVKHAQS